MHVNLKNRLHPDIQKELDGCQYPVEIVHSKRHLKIFIQNRLVGISPMPGQGRDRGPGQLNVRAQIRRAIRDLAGNRG